MVTHSMYAFRQRPRATDVELSNWLHLIHGSPAVRVEKIVAVREALRHNTYDNEGILSTTIARLEQQFGLVPLHP